MENINESEMHSVLLMQLLYQFQNMTLMHLGKLVNPGTGKAEKDLDQAKATIELVRMLKAKTKGNLNPKETDYIEQVLTNLQLNYADEAAKTQTEKKPENG